MLAWPVNGKGVAVPVVDAEGGKAPPATPLAPVPQEDREVVQSEIVGEHATPPKASQLGVVTDASARYIGSGEAS